MAANRSSLLGMIVGASNAVGVALIWLIATLMCFDVLSRNLFNKPIPGVSDLVASAVVLIGTTPRPPSRVFNLPAGKLGKMDKMDKYKLRRAGYA